LIVQQADAVTPLVSALKNAGQDIEVKGAVLGDQWAKMIVNLNNGLNVLTGRTLHEGFMQREYRLTLADCVEEALEVARLHQIEIGTFNGRSPQALLKVLRLPNFAYRLIMRWIVKMDKKARSSMLDDLEAGRGSEIEYLQGEIVKRAKTVDRLAPKNSAILMAVELAFLKGASPHLSGAELYRLVKKKAPLTQGRVWSKRRQ